MHLYICLYMYAFKAYMPLYICFYILNKWISTLRLSSQVGSLYTYSESWVRTDSVGKFPLNFWLWSVFLKTFNLLYQSLCYDTNTKSIEALCAQFWCHQPSTFTFRSSYHKLFMGSLKAHLTSTVWRPASSKVRKSRFGQRKKRPFRGVSLADNNFTG